MGGLSDLFKDGVGKVQRGFSTMKQKSADTIDHLRAIRNASVTPGNPQVTGPEAPEAPPKAARPSDTPGIRQNPARAAAQAARPAGGPVPMATKAQQAAEKATSRFGGMRGMAKKAGLIGAGIATVDALDKASEGQIPEQRGGTDALTSTAIEAFDSMTGIPNTNISLGRPLVHAAKGGWDAVIDPRPEGQAPGIIPKIERFGASIRKGWNQGVALGQQNPSGIPAGPASATGGVGGIPPQTGAPNAQGVTPAMGAAAAASRPDVALGSDLDPAAMLSNPKTKIPDGTGAIQRTGRVNPDTGAIERTNVGTPTLVDSRDRLRNAETQVSAAQQPSTRWGPIGELSAASTMLAGQRHAMSTARKNAEAGARISTASTAARGAREKEVLQGISDEVTRDTRGDLAKMDKEEREMTTGQRKADLAQRYRRSAAAIGKELGDLTPVETSQLKTSNDFRTYLENRGAYEWFRDFAGDKRSESESLWDYVPDEFEETAFGGYITMRGGNRIRVDKVVRKDGTTHWTTPNDPTDTDMVNLVKEARKKSKKEGK